MTTAVEAAFLDRVREAVTRAGLWDEFQTDWICLDCELMPWSAKAQALLNEQYAPVGASADAMLGDAVELLKQAESRGLDVGDLRDTHRGPPRHGLRLRRRLPPLLLAGRIQSTTSSSRRSTCSPPKARSTSTSPTTGTCRRWRGWRAGS